MTEIAASDALVELAFAALDHGLESVRDGDGPLVPFALTEGAEGRHLTRFAAELLEQGQEEARRHVRESDAERVALAYDGYLSVEGERSDAILVEAQERGTTISVVFAQRYRPEPFEPVGNTAFVGPGASLLD